jgi:tetratricopeptide (TPR) repeat protein
MHSDFDRAIKLFNRGDYFAAAENFENALRADDPGVKDLASALNRVAAALHLRFARGARQGAINLLSQALLALDDLKPARAGVNVERLFADVESFKEQVRATPRDRLTGIRHRARIFFERRRAPRIRLNN